MRNILKLVGALKAPLAVALWLAMVPTAAFAIPVNYQFFGTLSGKAYGPDPVPLSPSRLTLAVTDTAVASGSMNFQVGPGTCPGVGCVIAGDDSGFLSFGYGLADFRGGPIIGGGVFRISVRFNPDGTLGGGIFDLGSNSDISISGDEFTWGGTLASDASLCSAASPAGACTLSGFFRASTAEVPEPASIWLFGGGLLVMLLWLATLKNSTGLRFRTHLGCRKAKLSALLGILMASLFAPSASAIPVTYHFIGTVSGGANHVAPTPLTTLYLNVDSAAVQAGSLAVHIEGHCPEPRLCTAGGDLADFLGIGVEIAGQDFSGAPLSGLGHLNLNIAFNADGTLNGSIFSFGNYNSVNASGTGFNWSGTFGSDGFLNGRCSTCALSGYWTNQVPEPPTIVIVAAGLVLLAGTFGGGGGGGGPPPPPTPPNNTTPQTNKILVFFL
jgi:hypothetical protein